MPIPSPDPLGLLGPARTAQPVRRGLDAVPLTPERRGLSRSAPEAVAAAVALVLGGLHLLVRPHTGTDLAAQIARASFAAAHPATPVDLSWYGGVHPWGYSLLAPYVLAAVGIGLSGLLAAVGAAVLLARLLRSTSRPVAGAALGACFAVANVVSGRTTFALGAVAALAALVLLPRRGPATAAAVLSGLLSPVAAAFLGLAAAVLVLHRRPGGWPLGLGASVPVALLAWLFPSGGVQPYEASSATYPVLAGLALAVLTGSALLRTGAVLYAAAAGLLVLVSDPFGSNVLRLGLLLAAPLVVATATERWRLVGPVTLALVLWQVQPLLADLRAAPAPSFAELNTALLELGVKRVEVVPLRDHGEAAFVAPVVPLARGWSRQIDTDRNGLFYDGALSSVEYERWLRARAVDAVALGPSARADAGGRQERALLLVGSVPGLEPVWSDDSWRVWRFVDADPVAGEPAEVVDTDRTTVRMRSPRAAEVELAVHWSRWLSVDGPACLLPSGSGTRLRFLAAGEAVVGSSLRPRGHC